MAREVYLNRHGHWYVEGDGTCDKGHYYNEADAREAAAAPDMLAALVAWLEWDGEIRETPSPPMLACAAIAKAKGASGA